MSRKMILIGFLFILGSYSVFAQSQSFNWNGDFDGVLEQRLGTDGAALQTQVFHVIYNATANKDRTQLLYVDNYKEKMEEGYSLIINKIIRMYTDTQLGDCRWYRYDFVNNKIGTQLRKPYNVLRIIIYVTENDLGSGRFSNVDFRMTHVNADGSRYALVNADMTHVDTSRMNSTLLVLNDNLKKAASFLPSDGTGSPEFNIERFIQDNKERVIPNFMIEGIMPDTTSGIKR